MCQVSYLLPRSSPPGQQHYCNGFIYVFGQHIKQRFILIFQKGQKSLIGSYIFENLISDAAALSELRAVND